MALRIEIPDRTHEEFGHSLAKLLKINNRIGTTQETEIELDFSRARMLNPFFLGGLTCILNYHEETGKKITLNHQENYNIRSYLERIFSPTVSSQKKGMKISSLNNWIYIAIKHTSQLLLFPQVLITTMPVLEKRS